MLAARPDLSEVKSFVNEHRVALLAASSVLTTGYLFRKFYIAGGKCRSKRRLDGKTVIITGANAGIGKETAIDLAKRGARVILACRDPKRAQDAAKEVINKSGNGNVVVEILDLASLASVRAFAQRILAQEKQINILINNAGRF
jgi:FlaA1/EpsC-like NDP-sugar epimerase